MTTRRPHLREVTDSCITDGCITDVTCGNGVWDAPPRARHAAEAPMIRP
jgi:hypothetical protein